MRRQDKEVTEPEAIAQVLDTAEWGTLGLVAADGHPVLVPLNFLHLDGRIYFHGSPAGEKMDCLAHSGAATFLVVDAYAQVPSYAFDPVRACPATQYFKSVLLYGQIGRVTEGDLVVIIAGAPPGIPGSTNALRIHRMGDAINDVAPAYKRHR